MQLYEVELTDKANKLQDHFMAEYQKKYNAKAIIDDPSRDTFRFLIIQLKLDRAKAVVTHFLTMPGDNDWFVRNAHSLDTLRKNLNFVNASLGSKEAKAPGGGVMIETNIYCDKCGQRALVKVPLNYNFDQRTLCNDCRE